MSVLYISRTNGRRSARTERLTSNLSDLSNILTEKYSPARIIVETSGSAFPAPIAVQIRQLTQENKGVHLDSIITVVDCVHFRGYEVYSGYISLSLLIAGYFVHSKTPSKIHRRHSHEQT